VTRARLEEGGRGARRARAADWRGFTLIEVMAVMLLTGLVLTGVFRFYADLAEASRAASERLRTDRRAAAVVDRIARDLESAVLEKRPAEQDPLGWPWLFLAEDATRELGAQRLKFVSRGRLPRASALRESDLEVVAYFLAPREDGAFDLVRSSHPRLPESLDRSFPRADDPGSAVLSEGVAAFGVRLLSDQGAWLGEWDSSQLVESSELPLAAEIAVALLPGAEDAPLDAEVEEPELFVRRVLLPLRPLDVAKALESGREGAEEDGGEPESAAPEQRGASAPERAARSGRAREQEPE
jgi:prepilin-type N-terminal cleavage/methylation domain-containing protein